MRFILEQWADTLVQRDLLFYSIPTGFTDIHEEENASFQVS